VSYAYKPHRGKKKNSPVVHIFLDIFSIILILNRNQGLMCAGKGWSKKKSSRGHNFLDIFGSLLLNGGILNL